MLALGFMGTVVAIAIIATALLLIGLVLLQKNRGSGLSGAFGGVGGHSAFGNITGNFAFREAEDGSSKPGADVAETAGDTAPSGATPITITQEPAKAPADGDAAPFTFTTIPAGKTPPKPADGEPAKPAGG